MLLDFGSKLSALSPSEPLLTRAFFPPSLSVCSVSLSNAQTAAPSPLPSLVLEDAEGVSYLKRKWITLQLRIADSNRIRQYAPSYARHILISNILHGLERTLKGK